jgi:hypothetical protein
MSNNGIVGGCWCMGFHPGGVGRDTTQAQNRERKIGKHRWVVTRVVAARSRA